MVTLPVSRLEELQKFFRTHDRIKEYQAHTARVHSVGWNCTGTRLASGSFDKTVAVFSLEKDKLTKDHTYRGHSGSVDQLCWHATNPDLLATASGDKSVRIWDIRTQKCVSNVSTKGENINVTWAPNGRMIAVGNKEDLISFIDVRSFKIRMEKQFNFEVNEIKWNLETTEFFLTSGQGSIHVLGFPELKTLEIVKAHPGTCICIDMSPNGKYFATGSADALVSLWDIEDMACVRVFTRLDWPVRSVSFSHDGSLLASASEDLFIDISETETGLHVTDVTVDSPSFSVAWHPRQYLLAYACDDKEQYDRKRDSGGLKVFGFPNES